MIIGTGEKIFLVVNNLIMVFLMVITLYPLLYVLFCSLSDPIELGKVSGLMIKPAGFSLRGYKAVLDSDNIWLGFRNTIFYVIVGTSCSMAITIIGAYAIAKKNFMLRKPVMLFIIFTMYFGGGMIPTFLVVQGLHLTNTVWAMIVPGMLSVYLQQIGLRVLAHIVGKQSLHVLLLHQKLPQEHLQGIEVPPLLQVH